MHDEDELLLDGLARRLVWGADGSGKRRAQDFFEDLSQADQAKFDTWFERVANTQQVRNEEKFRSEGDKLFAFKIHKRRIMCFYYEGDLVLISGFSKKTDSDKRSAREISTAAALRDDYIKRNEKGR